MSAYQRAFKRGYDDYFKNINIPPYPSETNAHEAWIEGWEAAKEEDEEESE